ncbi:MAG: hypothetical protein AAF411_13600 [Myxococcota bacterium]
MKDFPALSFLLVLLVGACGACGGASSTATGTTAPEPGDGPVAGAPPVSAVPLPELPSGEAPPPERTAPTIASVADGEQALDDGFYAELRAALPNLQGAELLRMRFNLATGEYDAVSSAQVPEAMEGEAALLRAEAHMARGRLDDAEAILEPLAEAPTGFRAQMLLGRLHGRRGRSVEARNALMGVIRAYNDERIRNQADGLAYVAMAAAQLGAVRDANDAFGESLRAQADRIETLLASARLFLEKYDAGQAEENVRDALRKNPNHAEALALMARVRIDQSFNFAAAEDLAARALETNPNCVAAHVINAGLSLRDLAFDEANAHLDRALAVDPNDLEALIVRAAVRFLQDDDEGYREARREVLSRHRTFSRFYAIVGEFAEWEHRYPDLVDMAREAVTLNSRDARALAALGINQLRMGDEEAGLQALHDAWRRDRYNVRVYNTLNLFDEVIPQQYTTLETGDFTFRFPNNERAMLERYIPRTLQGAYDDMARRYGFAPEGGVRVELFGDGQHFAIRTVGLPNLDVQGVCFGKMFTALSPRGGPFNWGQIYWHELSHIFHIQLSRNRVPRWFTEGLAEYETNIARPEWRRELDHQLWRSLSGNRLPPLRLMNRAFTRARSAQAVIVAYYASTQIVRYIVDEYGFDKVVEMLRAWGAGKTSEEVVQEVLSVSIDELDAAFRASERQRLVARSRDFSVDFEAYAELEPHAEAAAAAPQDAAKVAAHAAALLVSGDAEGAKARAEEALRLSAAQPIARLVLARLAENPAEAEAHVQAVIDGGRDGYDLRLLLARSALGREDRAAARTALEAAVAIDADRAEGWQGLREVARQGQDAALLRRALTGLVRINEHDRESHAELFRIVVEASDWQAAEALAESGIFVDPNNAEMHRLSARTHLEQGRARDGLFAADSALIAEGEGSGAGQAHLLRATALGRLGQNAEAREAAEAAVQADASLRGQADAILQAL